MSTEVKELAVALRKSAQTTNQRRALLLSGERDWCHNMAQLITAAAGFKDVVWLGDEGPADVEIIQGASARKVLGRDIDAVVIDAYAGFDPDAVGAVAGAVRGGGLLILLSPRLEQWPSYNDPQQQRIAVFPCSPEAVDGRYLRRLARLMRDEDCLERFEQEGKVPKIHSAPADKLIPEHTDSIFRTADQRRAVEAIIHVVSGHRKRPVVLTSDRGRGKSAALGIAAAQLIENGVNRIIVTAPRLDAVEPLFENGARLLSGARLTRGELDYGDASVKFYPPDQLLADRPEAELLMVDEAAAIPTPLLQGMLENYSRIVFSTTVHGYEGTGRGFMLRFSKVLKRMTPDWKALEMEAPVRWAEGDPVEPFIFKTLLLDAVPAATETIASVRLEQCVVDRLERDRLAADEVTLREIFGLLVLAHYRTTPLDLRHLLDGPNLSVYVVRFKGHIVATALVAREGGIEPSLAHDIYMGRRRLRGHLLPQSLAVHSGFEEAPLQTGDRIMRIAVHPGVQQRGIGSMLLHGVEQISRQDGIDYIGSSFGSSDELLQFWLGNGYQPVRVGLTREVASGAHSIMLMKPISDAGQILFQNVRQRFLEHLPTLLSDPLSDLEPQLAILLLRDQIEVDDRMSRQDMRDLNSFAFGQRGYEVNMVPIIKLVSRSLAGSTGSPQLSGREEAILMLRVMERCSWDEVVKQLKLNGRGEAIELLRQAVKVLLQND